jgi:hypothetical protein
VAGVVVSELTRALREESKQVTYTTARDLMQQAADALEKVEGEADMLAHEAAREADRANAAEARVEELEPTLPPDFLNMP